MVGSFGQRFVVFSHKRSQRSTKRTDESLKPICKTHISCTYTIIITLVIYIYIYIIYIYICIIILVNSHIHIYIPVNISVIHILIIHTWHLAHIQKTCVFFFQKTHPGSAMVRRGNASRIKSGNSPFPTSMALVVPWCASTSPLLVPCRFGGRWCFNRFLKIKKQTASWRN